MSLRVLRIRAKTGREIRISRYLIQRNSFSDGVIEHSSYPQDTL